MSNIEDIIKTRQVQEEALTEINKKIQSCKESMQNYEQLSTRISTLPDKLTHSVMVPFGKLAFMPGKLIHTNELLVHLGDTWFASMTCKQAAKIVELRQKTLQDTLSDLEKVSINIEKKSQYLGDIRNAAEGKEIEIKEECPQGYVHPKDRRRISRIKNKNTEDDNSLENNTKPDILKSDKDLLARLDELEDYEEMEDEMDRLSISEASCSDEYIDSDDSSTEEEPTNQLASTKHVRFKDVIQETVSDPVEDEETPQPFTIRFRHTKNKPVISSDDMTPGDVYKLVQPHHKSILKQSTENHQPKVIKNAAPIPVDKDQKQCSMTYPKQTAVSDLVQERNPRTEELVVAPSSKPISRFKAGRKKF